jgi:dolichol-phosphate mannosyltransferase
LAKALVIIPTYNETENIERLIGELLALESPHVGFEVLVVDDSSADGTGEAVARLARAERRVRLLERPAKLGLGTAYVAGFHYALEHQSEFAVTMDADFSHDPKYLPTFAAAIGEADVVIGSRYIPGGGVRNWPLGRRILSAVANAGVRFVAGLKTHDCTTGYRLYRAELLRKLNLDKIKSHGYSCLMELVFVCERAGARIVESPIIFVDRRAGHSKVSHKEVYRAFATLYRLAVRRLQASL